MCGWIKESDNESPVGNSGGHADEIERRRYSIGGRWKMPLHSKALHYDLGVVPKNVSTSIYSIVAYLQAAAKRGG